MINPIVRFKNDNGNDYPDWEKCIVDDVFVERNEAHLITDDAPQLSFTIEQGVIYPEDKKTNKRDFLIKDKSSKKFLLTEYNDIIYNPANLKFGAIHRNKLGRGVVSPIYAIFKTDQDPAFMEYLVRNPRFIKRSLKYLEGTVIKLMTLKPRDFVKMKISVPCIEEQKRISDFLSKIDALIAISEKEVNKYKELKKGCLQTMFPRDGADVPEVRFPGFTDAWEQRKFGDTVLIERGGSPRPIDAYITDDENGLNWVKIGDAPEQGNHITHTAQKIKPEGLKKTRQVYPGDLILSNSMSFGRPYIMDIEGCIHDGWLLLRDEDNNYDLQFLCQLLSSEQMLNQYKSLAAGSTVNNLNKDLVGGTTVYIPTTIDEQNQIAEFLTNLDNLITLHQRECEKYRELKSGLLQKMFV